MMIFLKNGVIQVTDDGSYNTINKIPDPVEFKEKNSRFISFAFPVSSAIEADTILKALKKRFHDSSHVCFSYRIGNGTEDYFRFSDDGEPSGTAGMPIYRELSGAGLFNALIAVVRYFGGVKLGKGGLARAYSKSARDIINNLKTKTEKIKKRVTIEIEFGMIGKLMKAVDKYSVSIVDQIFNDNGVKLTIDIPETSYSEVGKYIRNLSKGKINI